MPIFDLARKPAAWLRVALVAVVLAFALDSIAHVVHRHDDSAKTTLSTHGPACGYCAAFDGLVDAPKHHYSPLTTIIVTGYVAPVALFPVAIRTHLSAQPRAPPR
ncbi:MAG: hypothetical protein ABW171_03330 [Steroidobacter sp.]